MIEFIAVITLCVVIWSLLLFETFLHELGHYLAAKYVGVYLSDIAVGGKDSFKLFEVRINQRMHRFLAE